MACRLPIKRGISSSATPCMRNYRSLGNRI
jgi:hypothetical protein